MYERITSVLEKASRVSGLCISATWDYCDTQ
jgi:hypothetical protein